MQDRSFLADYNLEDGCKVHLILQKEQASPESAVDMSTAESSVKNDGSDLGSYSQCPLSANQPSATPLDNSVRFNATHETNKQTSRFEIILRERLSKHFDPGDVEKIMANLQHEIDADINSSSLDDLERLAKQKLNISSDE